jgi:hypothetical protein
MGRVEGISNRAIKQLGRTRRSKHGWGHDHYDSMLVAFGFVGDERANHTIYTDSGDASNVVSVPRHRTLRDWVADEAITAIERRLARLGVDLNG